MWCQCRHPAPLGRTPGAALLHAAPPQGQTAGARKCGSEEMKRWEGNRGKGGRGRDDGVKEGEKAEVRIAGMWKKAEEKVVQEGKR